MRVELRGLDAKDPGPGPCSKHMKEIAAVIIHGDSNPGWQPPQVDIFDWSCYFVLTPIPVLSESGFEPRGQSAQSTYLLRKNFQ
jgi:hypothetical protein